MTPRYFLLRGVEAMTAEELAQNVMLILFQRAAEVRETERIAGWLFAVARHELLRYWRQAQTKIKTVEYEPFAEELTARFTIEAEVTKDLRLREWLSSLEPAERELIILRFVEDLSYEDLSLALGLPLGTIKWRLFHVKQKLSQIIGALYPNYFKQTVN